MSVLVLRETGLLMSSSGDFMLEPGGRSEIRNGVTSFSQVEMSSPDAD
jgi:hypothetical protein